MSPVIPLESPHPNDGVVTAIRWPHGRRFAFTAIDDTDCSTVANTRPFYESLERHGLRITKTVWGIPCVPYDRFSGETLADPGYSSWIAELASNGFEIAWHGARSGGSTREQHVQAFERFRELLGEYPRTYANHAQNVESLYWGEDRFDTPVFRALYRGLRDHKTAFQGDVPSSRYFWGDLCRERIAYVRNFTFKGIVTTQIDPYMPYRHPTKPYVRAWFSASEGANVEEFVELLTPENLDRLEQSGGACIVYTHGASGFVRDGRLDPRVESILADLERRNGWYVPVATLLNYIEAMRGLTPLTAEMERRLEWRWVRDQFTGALRSMTRKVAQRRAW